jgi:hypothetical protein
MTGLFDHDEGGSHEDRPSGRWPAVYCCWAFLVRTRDGITRRAAQCCTDRCRRGRRSLRYWPCLVRIAVAGPHDSFSAAAGVGQPSEPKRASGDPKVMVSDRLFIPLQLPLPPMRVFARLELPSKKTSEGVLCQHQVSVRREAAHIRASRFALIKMGADFYTYRN